MPSALIEANKALSQVRKEFLTLCKRSAKTLNRERSALSRQVKAARARSKRLLIQLQAKARRLSKATTKQASDMLEKQVAELKKLRVEARAEAKAVRAKLATVRVDLASARQHLAQALHAEKAMAAFERRRVTVAKRVTKKKKKVRKAA